MYKKTGLAITSLMGTLLALSSTSLADYTVTGTGYHINNQFSDPERCGYHFTERLVGFRGNAYQISTGAYHFAWIQGMCEDGDTTNPVGVLPTNVSEDQTLTTAPQGICPSGFYPNEVAGFYTAYGLGAFEYACLNPKTGAQQGLFHFGTDTQGSYNAARCSANDVMVGFKDWLAALNPGPGNLQSAAITEIDLICATDAQ